MLTKKGILAKKEVLKEKRKIGMVGKYVYLLIFVYDE